jgi:hypothetical protein
MYKISGPIASYALKVGDKNIVLFGDMHEGKSKQCMPCKKNCVYIVDLLNKMKPKTDIFIESYIYSQVVEGVQSKDVITDVILSNFRQMHNHKGKSKNNIKVHYSDIRSLICFQPFWLSRNYLTLDLYKGADDKQVATMNFFLQHISWCNTTQKIKQYIDIMLLSNDFIADVRAIIPKESQSLFVNKNDLMLLRVASRSFAKRKYVTRLTKQFNDLQPKYKDILLTFHEDMCVKLHQKTKSYDKAMSNYKLKNGTITRQDKYQMFYGLLEWGSHLKDLYTLARMLYYFDKTKNIISYDGAAHSKTYAYFFSTYMNAHVQHKESHFKEISIASLNLLIPTQLVGLRCVKLPKNTVEEVFDIE